MLLRNRFAPAWRLKICVILRREQRIQFVGIAEFDCCKPIKICGGMRGLTIKYSVYTYDCARNWGDEIRAYFGSLKIAKCVFARSAQNISDTLSKMIFNNVCYFVQAFGCADIRDIVWHRVYPNVIG